MFGQSAVEDTQLTQVSVAVSQTGVALRLGHTPFFNVPPTCAHCTQPPVERQIGVAVLQRKSGLGVGREPLSPLQPWHVFVVVLQEPVLPVHAVVFDASHWTHPPSLHTGKPALGQAVAPPEPKLPEHGPQPPSAVQIGRPGGQLFRPGVHV